MRVAVAGATGAVGTIMLDVLRRRGFPADEVVPFATARSEGRTLDNADAPVRVLADDTIEGFDLAHRQPGAPQHLQHQRPDRAGGAGDRDAVTVRRAAHDANCPNGCSGRIVSGP